MNDGVVRIMSPTDRRVLSRIVPRRQQTDRAVRHEPRNLMAAQNLDEALAAVHLENPPADQRPRRERREVIDYNKFSKTGKKH